MKYVIGTDPITGYYVPILFPDNIIHAHMAALLKISGLKLRSAGFVVKKANRWTPTKEKSESLGIGPVKGDRDIIRDCYDKGMSPLEMSNMATYRRIKKGKKP